MNLIVTNSKINKMYNQMKNNYKMFVFWEPSSEAPPGFYISFKVRLYCLKFGLSIFLHA